jgi:hypothetical protein
LGRAVTWALLPVRYECTPGEGLVVPPIPGEGVPVVKEMLSLEVGGKRVSETEIFLGESSAMVDLIEIEAE